jgi:hypothetical protein
MDTPKWHERQLVLVDWWDMNLMGKEIEHPTWQAVLL